MTDTAQRPYHALRAVPNVEELILGKLALGNSLQAVADELGVSDTAVLNRVIEHPDYKRTTRLGVTLRMDKREKALESAEDNVGVTRADRLLGHARWLAERQNSETYGAKSMVDVTHHGPLVNITVAALPQEYAPRITDVMLSADTQQPNVIEHDGTPTP